MTAAERRVALIGALRAPEAWPKNFTWCFYMFGRCALGLAVRMSLWRGSRAHPFEEAFRLTADEKEDVFFGGMSRPYPLHERDPYWCPQYGVRAHDVTALMVADKLEALHRQKVAAGG